MRRTPRATEQPQIRNLPTAPEGDRRIGSRGPIPRFSREEVFEAGLQIIDAEGRDALTMRRLAEELQVGKTTLYVYVETKKELLQGIEALLFGRLVADLDDEAPWDEQLTQALRRLYRVQRSHPGFVDVLTTQTLPGPALDPVREGLLSILRRAGFPPPDAVHALVAVLVYVLGWSISDRAHIRGISEVERISDLPQTQYPSLTEMAAEWGQTDPERDFEYGLALLIDSLKRKLTEPTTKRAGGRPRRDDGTTPRSAQA